MWRVYHRLGGWGGGGRVVVGERGGGEGWREGQSYASHKFSAACGLRQSVTMKWTEFPGLQPRGASQVRFLLLPPDQLGLEDEEILNVELKQGRVVMMPSSLFVDSSERKIVRHSEGRGDVCCGMLISLVARLSSSWNLCLGLD